MHRMNKTRKIKILLFIFMQIFLILCIGGAYSQNSYPQRIISLSPKVTEELYLLGVDDRLIAHTEYCEIPFGVDKKEKIGTVVYFNLEKVVSLEPDLVIATSLSKPKAKEKLIDLGIRVVTFTAAKSFDRMCDQFLELARIVGEEERAKEIVAKAKTETMDIKERIGNLPKPKVFAQIGAKPLFAATKDYFINDFIEFAGGSNIGRDLKNGLCSREEVLRADPEVIFIVTMGIVGEQEKKTWEKYKVIKAVEKNRIYILDSDKLCSPTPASFVDTLEEIVEILHRKEAE